MRSVDDGSSVALPIGTLLETYELREVLGQGGGGLSEGRLCWELLPVPRGIYISDFSLGSRESSGRRDGHTGSTRIDLCSGCSIT